MTMADRTLYDDLDEQATRWGRRAIAGAALSCIALLAFTGHEPTDNGRRATPVVAEDDPGWDCATMGNHVCGPCP